MTDLITLAREKLAYDEDQTQLLFEQCDTEIMCAIDYDSGAADENARTKPITDALLNCADVLEKIILLMEGSPSIAPYTDAMVLELARQRRDELEKGGER